MNPIYNNYLSIMNEMNQDLKDFEVLGQIEPGNKIGVDRNHHFYISSGSTQGFIGSKIQGSQDKPQTLKLLNMFGFESSIVQKKGDREKAENVFKFLINNYKNIIVHSWKGFDFLDSSHSQTASTSSELDDTGIIIATPPEIDIEKHLKEI